MNGNPMDNLTFGSLFYLQHNFHGHFKAIRVWYFHSDAQNFLVFYDNISTIAFPMNALQYSWHTDVQQITRID